MSSWGDVRTRTPADRRVWRRLRLLLAVPVWAAWSTAGVAAHAAPPPPTYAASASVAAPAHYLGDTTGTVFTFTVTNTGTKSRIGAVELTRPSAGWQVTACPTAPSGWTSSVTASSCQYLSGPRTNDDIAPGGSRQLPLRATTAAGTEDRTGTWVVRVSRSSDFTTPSQIATATPATASALQTTAHTWQVVDAHVAAGAVSGTCPNPNKTASGGSSATIAVCARNHATSALQPVVAQSSLGGTLVSTPGTFSAASVAGDSQAVAAQWASSLITSALGTDKTVITRIGSSANQTSPLTTLTGYAAVNSPPVAVADSFNGNEDSVISGNVLTNDSDGEGDAMTAVLVSDVARGSLALASDGAFTYTPTLNTNGTDSFTYRAADALGSSSTVTVTLTVAAVNDGPVNTVPGAQSLGENGSVVFAGPTAITVSDVDATALTSTLSVSHGTLALGTTSGVTVTGNGTGTLTVEGSPSSVNVALNGLTYAPTAGYSGSDTLTVLTADNGSSGAGGALTDTDTVALSVSSVNDAPSFTKGADQTVAEDAGAQSVSGWATALSTGPADESSQTLTFTTTNDNNGLFASQPAVSSTGTLTYTPAGDAFGTATVSVEAKDDGGTANGGDDTSDTQTFTITVAPVNDTPSFTKGADQTVNEDAGAQGVSNWATAISKGPANESAQTLTFTTTNDNNGLFAVQPSVSDTGDLSYTPAADANGSATVTLALSDDAGGADTSPTQTFTITVRSVNDTPSFTKGADQTVNEDAGAQSVSNWATAISKGPADESAQTLTFTTSNDNNALFAVQPGVTPTGTLVYTPAADAFGSATVTISLSDSGGTDRGGDDTSDAQTFTITVDALNDAPTFTKGADQTVIQDSGSQLVTGWATNISAGAPNEAAQTLTFSTTNGNNGLFTTQPAVSSSGELTYTPATGATGSATVSVWLSDDGGTANGGDDTSDPQTFTITVTPPNAAPTADATSASGNEDGGARTVTLTGHDSDGDALTFDVGTATNGLVTVPGAVTCTGTPSTCTTTVTYTPNAHFFGTDSFTYKVNDGTVDSAAATVSITVNAVNDAPSFTKGADQTVNEDSGAQTVSGWATALSSGPANEAGQTVSFITTNDDNGLFATQPAVSASGDLTYTPATHANGSATVTVGLFDDGGTANGGDDSSDLQTFTITVGPVNDAPSFTKGADQTVNEDAGAQSVSNWGAAISKGPADESGQSLSFTTSNDNNSLFSTQPGVTPTGTLVFTTAANKHGTATVTITLSDSGGTANGGDDTTDPQTFTITVSAVNDPPTAAAKSYDVQTNMKISLGGLLTGASDAADTSQNPSYTPSFTLAAIMPGAGCVGCTVSNVNSAAGTFDFDPPAGGVGTYTISYTVRDTGDPGPGAVSAAQTITLNVSGPVIWFVDAAAGPGGTGRLSAPFQTLGQAAGVDAANHRVHLAPGTYTDGMTLLSGEWLTGAAAKATSFDALMGITPPAGTIARPALSTTAPTVQGSVVLGSNNTLRGLTLTGSPAVSGSSFGTLSLGSGSSADVALSSAGQALSLSSGTVSGDLLSVSSSGGSNNVLLSNVASTGTSLGSGALSGATSEGLRINGGSGSFSYSGTIGSATGADVSIANKTGGAVTISGAVSDTSGPGVLLTNNAGTTVAFTGGVSLLSGTSAAFVAAGGGTVSITGAGNTLASTTGTALSVVDTTIGAADLTFRSISANGAQQGIVLSNTGSLGGLVVTGDGGTCTVASTSGCSGGVIGNTVGSDNSGAVPTGTGIVLNGTRDVSLTRMHLHDNSNYAVRGTSVTNLSLADSVINGTNGSNADGPFNDGSVRLDRAFGTLSVTRVAVSGGFGSNVEVNNDIGTLNATFDGVTIGANSTSNGNDGLQVEGIDTATVNTSVLNSTFTSSRGDLVQYVADGTGGGSLNLTGNTLANNHPAIATGGGGVSLMGGAGGPVTMTITNNTSRDAVGHAWLVVKSPGAAGAITGTFSGNTVGLAAVANSGSREGDGLRLLHSGGGNMSFAVTNNAIRQYNGQGVMAQAGAGIATSGTLSLTSFSGNTIATPGTNPAVGTVTQGFHLNSGVTPGDTFTTCANLGTNTINGSGRNGGTDFRLRQRQSTTVRLPGYGGAAGDTAAVIAFAQGRIGGVPSGSAVADFPGSGGGFVGTAC